MKFNGADGSRTHDLLNAMHSVAVTTVRDRPRLCVEIEHSRPSLRPSGIDADGKTIAEPLHGVPVFLTKSQARQAFPGVGYRPLDRAFATGEPALYRFGAWPKVKRDDLQRWIERHRRPARGNGSP